MFWYVEVAAILICALFIVISAFVTELSGPVSRWWAVRWNPFWDAGQSAAVRRWALRLSSRRRSVRVEAVERLTHLGDATAVPALVKAVEWYAPDVRFMELAVQALRQMGDERAIPALRRLTSGRHYALMAAAREAVAELEPRSVLLRAADSAGSRFLLRPSLEKKDDDCARLLRVVEGHGRGSDGREGDGDGREEVVTG